MIRPGLISLVLLFLVQVLLPACESESNDTELEPKPISLLGETLVIDSSLVLVDVESDRAFLLDLSADDLGAGKRVIDLPANPFLIERRKGSAKEALILSAGRRGVAESTALLALRVNGETRAYQVSAPFDSLVQTEDGRYAVLYCGDSSERQLLASLNEIAIVDLEAEVDERAAVVRRSVETPGGPPTGLQVSPALALGYDEKLLAVLLSDSHATLVDLDDLERSETVIRLSSGEGEDAVRPEQVVFHAATGAIFLRAANSDDVFAIRIERDGSDFETTIEQLTAGTAPSEIAVYGEEDAARLLVVSQSDQQVHIVDISESSEESDGSGNAVGDATTVVHIDLPRAADSLLIYESEAPENSHVDIQQHALLYREGGQTVTFLDLLDAERAGERNLQTVRVGDPIVSLELLEEQNLVLIVQESSRIRVLDLQERKVITTVNVEGSLYNAVFSADLPRLWIAPPGQYFAGCVNLQSGDTEEVLLDRRLAGFALAPLPELAVAIHQIAGEEELGTVDRIAITVLDALDPDRDEAVTFDAFIE